MPKNVEQTDGEDDDDDLIVLPFYHQTTMLWSFVLEIIDQTYQEIVCDALHNRHLTLLAGSNNYVPLNGQPQSRAQKAKPPVDE
ncbi:hypothetical protein DAPPUDRAFT_239304 [Daphnia pulex]|uniref:Uncharacterized protein n=1 Tax=Daphnia pulex TaxID=6669 RepID=E9G8Y0_DAPPU|nr:hypothetical protein DAPPUDRAFT_239304 [Daphnia pulex]|eukprot:EFX84056.1 hypothetical protein DAPPUDRAFT_239304 [Daphnia pulex]